MSLIKRAGRVAIGVPFIWLGYEAAKDPGGRTKLAEDMGVPQAEMAVRANGAAMVLGGAALATGVLPRVAAAGLIASLIPTTVAGHAFWKIDDPSTRTVQRIQVLKNLGLIGGLALVAGGSD